MYIVYMLCSSVIKEIKVNPVQCKAYGHRIENLKQKNKNIKKMLGIKW